MLFRRAAVWAEENVMTLGTILLIILILLLIGAFPAWPHSRSWGYYPTGGLGLILLIILILVLTGPDLAGHRISRLRGARLRAWSRAPSADKLIRQC